MQPGDAPGPRAPPAEPTINLERSPSRRATSSHTALAVSNGSAAQRRTRAAFSPPQSATTRAASQARAAVRERQASRSANLVRDAARGAGTSVGSTDATASSAAASAAPATSIDVNVLHLGPPGKNYKKPRLVHVVGSGGPGDAFHVRQANGVEIFGVPRSRLSTRLEADPAVFRAAELAARKLREVASASISSSASAASASMASPASAASASMASSASAASASMASPAAETETVTNDDELLYLGPLGKNYKKPRLVHIVGSRGPGNTFDVRQANGVKLSDVPRSRLSTRLEADPAVFQAAELAARKLREVASASTSSSASAASASMASPASAASASMASSASAASASMASPAAETETVTNDDELLYLGPLGKNYKKPRLVHIVGSRGPGNTFDVRQANGVKLSDVPRSRLSTRLEADPAVFQAAELAARKLRTAAAATAPAGPPANGLAPSADRLAQVAEAAQNAISDITARTVCAVCCCTVQEASTVPVVVTEQPPTGWHAKLKATPAMGLHAELRAQYTIGDDSADVHPLWTEMCVNLVVNSTAAFAWRSLPPALTLALPCLRCAPGCCVQRHCTTQAQVSGPLTCATAASRASTASGPRPHQRTASPTATSGGTRRPCQGSPTSHNR